MSAVETGLDVEVERKGEVALLRLCGALNIYTIPFLTARFEDVLQQGAVHLAVGLAGVEFLDSEGIGLLLRVGRRIGCGARSLALAGASEQARKTIAVKGLSRVLPCFGSEDDACAFLSGTVWYHASGLGGEVQNAFPEAEVLALWESTEPELREGDPKMECTIWAWSELHTFRMAPVTFTRVKSRAGCGTSGRR